MSGTSWNRETKSCPFGPPPKASSYKRGNEVLHQRGKSFGAKHSVQNLNGKGMQTQCEVKISPEYLFSQNLNSLPFHGFDMAQFISFKWNSRVESEHFLYMEGQGS
jgi:hypothetical protein